MMMQVAEVNGEDVVCLVKNSVTLSGLLYTLHVSQIHINLPTLTDKDKEVISSWGVQNNIDILSLSYTRHAEDVRHVPDSLFLMHFFHGLTYFDEILQEADGVILSRGNLVIDLPPEKVFLFQKTVVFKCNMAGKPAVVTRVVDSMTENLRPTRAEATDVANAILDGNFQFEKLPAVTFVAWSNAILLGAETLRGLHLVETISIVGRICAEVIFLNYSSIFP
ncbi:hypothetical protein POTOM_040854 [Populus tomentosa]|uniref:Pyruvate kinase barrel domain-containing protein n=1 Tax=Populus tomentosa TaxID=118781 RepID=A0A8X7YRY9_POPTO|nr:hypothetical protein POTOM_040854 [Populus tomentosa]